MIRAV